MAEPERADRPGDQPLPVINDSPSIQSLVRTDLDAREQVGIQRYGTPLQPHNGRDALRDLYEELLDATCYVRQVMEERPEASASWKSGWEAAMVEVDAWAQVQIERAARHGDAAVENAYSWCSIFAVAARSDATAPGRLADRRDLSNYGAAGVPSGGDPEPEQCGASEGATGIDCDLIRYHSLSVDHEGSTTPGQAKAVGYQLFVRWPWQSYDRDHRLLSGRPSGGESQ